MINKNHLESEIKESIQLYNQGHFKKALNLAVQLVQNNPGISRYLQLKHQLELLVP